MLIIRWELNSKIEFAFSCYYFSNRNSNLKVVDIKQPDNKIVEVNFNGDIGEGYSKYHDQHRVDLELVGLQPGETEINQLTMVFSDGSENTVDIGNIVYIFRKPSGFLEWASITVNGSSSENRDFAQYEAKKSLALKKISYQLPQLKEDILKIVLGDSIDLASKSALVDDTEHPSDILRADISAKVNLQNTDLNLKLSPQKPLLFTSYFSFKNIEQYEKKIYSFINSELIFIDETGQEIIGEYDGEYLPYLKASEIRDLSNTKTEVDPVLLKKQFPLNQN